MTKKCFYCGDVLTEGHFMLDHATMIMPETYGHTACIADRGDKSLTGMTCHYCDKPVMQSELVTYKAVKIGRDRYAHPDCIDSHGKENTVNDQTQRILGAVDSAHQGIDLARSLLQSSLADMGEILTAGCEKLGIASLGSTMRLGQKLKEAAFLLGGLRGDAHGLCVLLGKDLGVVADETKIRVDGKLLSDVQKDWVCGVEAETLNDGPPRPSAKPGYRGSIFGDDCPDFFPGEDEFDDDETPF